MKRLFALLTVLILLSGCVGEKRMGILFDESAEQGIEYPVIAGISSWPGSLPQKTTLIWFHMTNLGAQDSILVENQGDTGSDQTWEILIEPDGDIRYTELFTGFPQDGWTTDQPIANGNDYVLAISYDNTNLANDPIIYVNGGIHAWTQGPLGNPTGVPQTGTDSHPWIGGPVSAGTKYSINGIVYMWAVYDSILSQAKIIELGNLRYPQQILSEDVAPIFLVSPNGAAGIQNFGGAVLAGANVVREYLNGYPGTPANSPVGYADDFLHIR